MSVPNAWMPWVDSGTLYIPKSLFHALEAKADQDSMLRKMPPGVHDLYLTGEPNIKSILFGDSTNYESHWHDRFKVTGKPAEIRNHTFVFRIDSYEKRPEPL